MEDNFPISEDGIIGIDFLKQFNTNIDFEHNIMTLNHGNKKHKLEIELQEKKNTHIRKVKFSLETRDCPSAGKLETRDCPS